MKTPDPAREGEDPALDPAMRAALAELRRARDVRYGEVRFVNDSTERLRVRDGRPEQAARAVSSGVGIRALASGAWGFACRADTS
jgi:predicted Zn-dependent protease